MSNNRNKSKSGGKKGMVAAIILIWVIIISIIVAIIIFMKKDSNDEGESTTAATTTEESTDITSLDDIASYTDAETYFNENSDVVSVVNANESSTVLSEKDTIDELRGRGFGEYDVECDYDMNGELLEEDEEDEDGGLGVSFDDSSAGSDKHPMYQTYYINSSDEVWTIFVIDNMVMANPVSFNMESEHEAQVIFSEKDSVMSYDCETNKYYETVPDKSALIVINEGTINTELLDNMTKEEIEKRIGE